jgi:hypothetical protein
MCQQLTLECLGTPDTNTSDASKLQLVGCSAESGGIALINQVKAFVMVAEGAWPEPVRAQSSPVQKLQKDVRKTRYNIVSEDRSMRDVLWVAEGRRLFDLIDSTEFESECETISPSSSDPRAMRFSRRDRARSKRP